MMTNANEESFSKEQLKDLLTDYDQPLGYLVKEFVQGCCLPTEDILAPGERDQAVHNLRTTQEEITCAITYLRDLEQSLGTKTEKENLADIAVWYATTSVSLVKGAESFGLDWELLMRAALAADIEGVPAEGVVKTLIKENHV